MCMQTQSNESKMMKQMQTGLKIVQSDGPIKKYKLAFALKMTPSQYNRFHPYFGQVFEDDIEYDEVTQEWKKKE